MSSKYTVRVAISQMIIDNVPSSNIKDVVVQEMLNKFNSVLTDKINPMEIYTWDNSRVFEQQLYVFTPDELREYVRQCVVQELGHNECYKE